MKEPGEVTGWAPGEGGNSVSAGILPASATTLATPAAAEAGAAEATAVQTPRKQRSLLIDILRGLAITLVALGHTNQGLLHRDWWGTSPRGDELNRIIYSFHMPAFFFVSGIFLLPGVRKRGPWAFTVGKLKTMIYPYLLWAPLFALLPLVVGSFMNEHVPTLRVFLVATATGSAQWFLPTIFFAVTLAMLLRRVPLPLLFVLSCLGPLFWPRTGVMFVDRGIDHLPFVVLGMWVGMAFTRVEQVPRWAAAAASAVLCVAVIVLPLLPRGQHWLFLPEGLLGTLMLLLISRVLGSTGVARLLAWCGEASFGIFLMSAFGQVLGRELLAKGLHTTEPWLHLAVSTVTATLLPAWIYMRRDRLYLGWLFVWPFDRKTA